MKYYMQYKDLGVVRITISTKHFWGYTKYVNKFSRSIL